MRCAQGVSHKRTNAILHTKKGDKKKWQLKKWLLAVMHARLFENQRALEPWSGHAEALGLDVAAFDGCMSSGRHADAVRKDMAEAGKAGATGTPSFVLARTDPGDPGKVTGLSFLRGAQPFNAFKSAIDSALEKDSK